jgi:hypothetical protein
MMKLVTAVVFTTIVAGSAFAQSYVPSVGSGNLVKPIYPQTTQTAQGTNRQSVPVSGQGSNDNPYDPSRMQARHLNGSDD